MQGLSIFDIQVADLFDVVLLIGALVFATLTVVSKNITDSILFFVSMVIVLLSFFVAIGNTIVGCVIALVYISITSCFLILNLYSISSKESYSKYRKIPIYLCATASLMGVSYIFLKPSARDAIVQHKYYDSTMYVMTFLLAVMLVIVIFGLDVFLEKRQK